MPFNDKEAKRDYMRAYRQRMTEDQKKHARAKCEEREREIREWFEAYKKELACVECGEDHPACLEFHHLNPAEKEANVFDAVWHRGWSKEHILAEIAKCKVLCANCHKKLHYDLKRLCD